MLHKREVLVGAQIVLVESIAFGEHYRAPLKGVTR